MKKKIAGYTILLILSIDLCGCKSQSKTKDVPVSEAPLGGWEMAENEAGELPEDTQKAFDAVRK